MDSKQYSAEKNIQVAVALLKAYGIRKVIASPGTTNLTFVASLQHDPFFTIYSAPEERSAAYMAVGMAEESGEPVVITCTGATASRNYLPALTEAYYRKLPVIAMTATQPKSSVGQLVPQVIDRGSMPNDAAVFSVHISTVKDRADFSDAVVKMNEALHHLRRNGGGPVHINLETTYNSDFSVKELPVVRKISYYDVNDSLPEIKSGKIGIFVGAHSVMCEALTEAIDRFCARYDAVVFCDHTSNYHGKYRFLYPLVNSQDFWPSPAGGLSLMIHIGEVSGSYSQPGSSLSWRVSEDGMIRNPFGNIGAVFDMSELEFFNHYAPEGENFTRKDDFLRKCLATYDDLVKDIPENLPFSNIWVASRLSSMVPQNAVMHFGILNSLRSWNFFRLPDSVDSYSNVGGFGIDGALSTVIGGALVRPDRIHFIVLGDLAFFYDMNSLGNRHLPANLRILLVNNGRGTEFTNYNHPAYAFGAQADEYMAAAGHYGRKSPELVKHYAQDLGFKYLHASDKQQLLENAEVFMSPEKSSQPILMEVFTDSKYETDALHIIRTLRTSKKSFMENTIKTVLGRDNIEKIKSLLGR